MLLTMEKFKTVIESGLMKGKKVVTTNGCFDILHAGHVFMLQKAKMIGDVLIVGLNSDSSVRKIRGVGHPIISADQRAQMLDALACVDYVVTFDEETPEHFLKIAQTDVHVKSEEYKGKDIVEKRLAPELGFDLIFVPRYFNLSTTDIIKKAVKTLRE